jgi:NAD(P)-dependent dehydrogenase (short-subunit alcohol dehydrogenase family)
MFIRCDLRDVEALRAAIGQAEAEHGAATVLINNAALDTRHDVADVTVDFWENNLAVNLRPHFFTAQAVLPGMRAAGRGSIINFTSTSFMINHPDMPAYTAAKAGIIGLTKGLAGKLGRWGIRVNAIAPGWVITERQRELWVTQEALAAHVQRQCIREVMTPEDIVGPCLFLASDASRMLTAQTMIVDGGFL